jgi:zinc protease
MQTAIDRKLQPLTSEIEKIDVAKAKKYTLDNGISVYAVNAGFQDLVKIELIFFNKGFDVTQPLLNSATNRMLADGTSKYTAQQLADHIDYYGSFYETDENYDFTSVMIYSLNKHLEATLPFVSDILHDPVFPASELETFVRNNKQRLTVENEKVSSLARRKFSEIIFGGNHPYGYYTQTADYDKLNRDVLAEHFRKKYSPANCTILISGLIKDDSIKMLNKFFGQGVVTNGTASAIEKFSFSPSAQKKHFIEKEGAVQSALRIGKPFFNRTHPDYPGMAVLNTLLGGYFGSRLMSNIREDKGYTYGIGSAIVSMRQEGYFFISTEVGADVTSAAISEIYKEIELLKDEPIESEELEMARNYMLGTFLKGMDGAFQLAERFKSIYFSGLDYGYYDRYLQKIRTIQPDELQELARKYFSITDFFEIVVGRK